MSLIGQFDLLQVILLREIIVNAWCFSPRGMYVCIARQDFPYRSIETRFRTDRTSQTTSQMIG